VLAAGFSMWLERAIVMDKVLLGDSFTIQRRRGAHLLSLVCSLLWR
jgi:hypothetical protein